MARYLAGEMTSKEEIAYLKELEHSQGLVSELEIMEKNWKYIEQNPQAKSWDSAKGWLKLHKKLETDGVTLGGNHTTSWDSHGGRIDIAAEDRDLLDAYLVALRATDKLVPREMVIRGRVEDSGGDPVAGAVVDLMGPYVYVNHFRTREDGTFVMPMTPNEGWGYYLRIRPEGGEPETTGRFSLSYDEPERVVIVRLP